MILYVYFLGVIILYSFFRLHHSPLDSCSIKLVLMCSIYWPLLLGYYIVKSMKRLIK